MTKSKRCVALEDWNDLEGALEYEYSEDAYYADEGDADHVCDDSGFYDESSEASSPAVASQAQSQQPSVVGSPKSSRADDVGPGCAICFEDLFEESKGILPQCRHSFCLTCIVKWARVNPRCPLCKIHITHVDSHFELDGTYVDVMKPNLLSLMAKTRWLLTLDDDVTPDEPKGISIGGWSGRQSGYDRHYSQGRHGGHAYIDDDGLGDYAVYSMYEDEFEPTNYAPNKGKAGRNQRISAGGVSIHPSAAKNAPHHTGSLPTNATNTHSSSSVESTKKLGRRARRRSSHSMSECDAAAV
eukprot:Opistho-2@51703